MTEEPKVADKHKERPFIPRRWEVTTDYEMCRVQSPNEIEISRATLSLKLDGENELGQAFLQNRKFLQKQGVGASSKR